jgi:hypothetical protein
VLSSAAGHHRFSWDLHYDPLPGGGGGRGGGGAGGAVPRRTYPGVSSPWVAPGTYNVRLTADGKSVTQLIVVKIDPRVKVTPAIQQIFTLTTQMEDGREPPRRRPLISTLRREKLRAKTQSAANDALIKELDALAPPAAAAGAGGPGGGFGGRGGRGGRGGGAGAPGAAAAPEGAAAPTFTSIGPAMVAAAMAMQDPRCRRRRRNSTRVSSGRPSSPRSSQSGPR